MDISYYNVEKASKAIVIFIAGFTKKSTTWNVTETGKTINIEVETRKRAATVLVAFDDATYSRPVTDVCTELYQAIAKQLPQQGRVIVVSHSLGGFHATMLARLYALDIHAIVLLDPVAKIASYHKYLTDTLQQTKLENYDSLPDASSLSARIVVKVYLTTTDSLMEKLDYFDKLTRANIHSDIIVCPHRGHMLHYEMPAKFIAVIQQLI